MGKPILDARLREMTKEEIAALPEGEIDADNLIEHPWCVYTRHPCPVCQAPMLLVSQWGVPLEDVKKRDESPLSLKSQPVLRVHCQCFGPSVFKPWNEEWQGPLVPEESDE